MGKAKGKTKEESFLPASFYIGIPVYMKSNELILSLSAPSLVTNKLLMICTMRANKTDRGLLKATLTGSELHKIFGKSTNSGSFYETIKNACYRSTPGKSHNETLLDYKVVLEDKKHQSFSAHNIVTDAEFNKGVLSVTFNPNMEQHIIGMKNNYTCLDPDEMMSMKSIYSYRFLEMFKQDISFQDWIATQNNQVLNRDNKPYCVRYEVTKLKLMMNIIDASNANIFKTLQNRNKSYNDVEALDESSNKEFSNFRRNVLEVAKKELDEKASIRFEYEQERTGRGGKTTAVVFFVYVNEKNVKKAKKKAENADIVDIDDQIDRLRAMLKENLPTKTLRSILEVANGNIENVMKVYKLAEESGTDIQNLPGYLIDGLRKDYPSKVIPKKSGKKTVSNWDINGSDDGYEEFMKRYE